MVAHRVREIPVLQWPWSRCRISFCASIPSPLSHQPRRPLVVRIVGARFDGAGLRVRFGDQDALLIDLVSDTEVAALVPPASAGAVDISLETDAGVTIIEDGYTEWDLFARYETEIGNTPTTFGVNVENANNVFFFRTRGNANERRRVVFSVKLDLK